MKIFHSDAQITHYKYTVYKIRKQITVLYICIIKKHCIINNINSIYSLHYKYTTILLLYMYLINN